MHEFIMFANVRSMKYLIFALFLIMNTAEAATIKLRDVTFNDKTEQWIIVKGAIQNGDLERFLSAVTSGDKISTVWLDSPGGSANEGLAIARIIHELKFNTYVHENSRCDSICSIMFLSGKRKLVTDTSKIGIHSAHNRNTGAKDADANTVIGWYMGKLGYPEELLVLWVRTKPDSLIDLNDGPNKIMRLGFERVDPVPVGLLERLFDQTESP